MLVGGREHIINKAGIKYILYQMVTETQKYQAGKGNRQCQRWRGGRGAISNKVVKEGLLWESAF